MPKVKTNSGAKKRFRFTGTGKIKRHHAYHSHILTEEKSGSSDNRRQQQPQAGSRLALPPLILLVKTFKGKENYAKISQSCCF